jgi:hypothetical protein
MACLKFLSENFADTAQLTLTTGTVNAQFPLSNLQNDSPSKKFRGVGSTVVIEIDLLQTRDLDTIAFMASPTEELNIISASVKTSVTNDFSLSVAYPMDLSSSENMGIVTIPEVSNRYVELTLTSSVYSELGKLFIGKAFTLEQNGLSIDSFSYKREDQSTITRNRYGQAFIDQLNKVKFLGGSIEFANKEEQEDLDDMFIRHGESLPLWLIIDEDNEAMNDGQFKLSIYGYLTASPVWSASGGRHYNTTIEIRQAI